MPGKDCSQGRIRKIGDSSSGWPYWALLVLLILIYLGLAVYPVAAQNTPLEYLEAKYYPEQENLAGMVLIGTLIVVMILVVMVISLIAAIIQRRQAEKTLQESEERLRLALEGTTDGIWDWDPRTGQAYFSPRYYTMLGYEPGEFSPTYESWRQLLHPDDAVTAEQAMQHALAEHTPFAVEARLKAKNGEWRWILGRGKVVELDVERQAVRMTGSHTDITERKRMEEALRASETFLETIIEYSPHSMWVADDKGTLMRMNQACRNLVHVTDEELVGKYNILADNVIEEQGLMPLVKRVFEHGERVRFTIHYDSSQLRLLPLGETVQIVLEVAISPILDAQQRVTHAIIQQLDVTELKRAEEALQKSNDLLRAIIEAAPTAIIGLDLDGKVHTVWNRAAEKMLGWSAEEVMGRFLPSVPLENVPEFERFRERIRSGKPLDGVEVHRQKRDGTPIDYSIYASPLHDVEGKISGNVAVMVDITERKRIEEALRQANLIVENSPVMLFRWKAAAGWPVVLASQNVAQIGYTPAEFLDQSVMFASLVHPDDLERVEREVQAYSASGVEHFQQEYRIITKDRQVRWLDDRTFVERDANGNITHFQGIVVDITEHKQAEETLREKIEELDRFFTVALDLLCIADTDGYFRRLNPQWKVVLGYSLAELEGKRFLDLVHPEDQASTLAALGELGAQRSVLNFVNRYRCQDGSYRWIEWRSYPVGNLIYAAARDITERKQAEEALLASEARLRAIIDRAPFGAHSYELQPDGCLIFVGGNPSADKILGVDHALLVGKTIEEAFPGLVDSPIPAAYRRVAAGGENFDVDQSDYDEGQIRGAFEVHAFQTGPNRMTAFFRDITERKRAELALQESEQKFRAVVQSAQAVIFILDREGRFLLSEGQALVKLGLSPGQVAGRSALELYQDYPSVLEGIKGALAGVPTHVINVVQDVVFDVVYSPYYNLEGILTGVIGIAIDITERKRAEEALRESEFFLRKSQSVARLGSYYLDIRTGKWISSPGLDEIFGIDDTFPKDLEGWIMLVHPEQKEEMLHYLHQYVLAEHNRFDKDYRIIRYDDQQERWMHGSGELEFDEAGNTIKMIGTIQDITERKQVEQALRTGEERYRQAQALGHVGNWEYDIQTTKFWGSDEAKRIFEFDPQAVTLTTDEVENCIPERERVHQALVDLIERGQEYNLEFDIITHDTQKRKTVISIAELEKDTKGLPLKVTGVIHDITDRKQAEVEIRQLNEELEQRVAERTAQLEAANKELEAFSYSVSHDLRVPLRAVDGYTRILVEDYESALTAEGQRVCGIIRNETRRMGQLIDDLLAFSRLGRTMMQPVLIDMAQLVKSVFSDLTTAESREQLEFRMGDLPPAVGDPALIRQVWINLLANALKFSSKREQAVIEVGSQQSSRETVYWVRDNGAGFDMQYADRLFSVFQRLHSQREFAGTGVGLAIVQRVIHRHGGRIWAEGEVDRGATFYFTFPRKGD